MELVAIDVLRLDGFAALICGGSAVYHFFGWRYGVHGPVCNLPSTGLNGCWAVSALLERRNHQGRLRGNSAISGGDSGILTVSV